MYAIFLTHLFITIYIFGVISFVQVIHYPLLSSLKGKQFALCEQWHVRRMTWFIAVPLVLELITACLLLFQKPPFVPGWLVWSNAVLLLITWLSSLLVQVPLHYKLVTGFDEQACHLLIQSNWVRTILWFVRSLLLLSILAFLQ